MSKVLLELDAKLTKYFHGKIYAAYDLGRIFFTKIVNILMAFATGIFRLIIFLMGCVTIIAIFSVIFENGAGFADLSRMEWLFFIISAFLLWRISYYCRFMNEGFLKVFYRIGLAFGISLLLILFGLFIAETVFDHKILTPLVYVACYVCFFINLYLAIPGHALSLAIAGSENDGDNMNNKEADNNVDKNETTDVENDVNGTWGSDAKGAWGNDEI